MPVLYYSKVFIYRLVSASAVPFGLPHPALAAVGSPFRAPGPGFRPLARRVQRAGRPGAGPSSAQGLSGNARYSFSQGQLYSKDGLVRDQDVTDERDHEGAKGTVMVVNSEA